MGAELETGERGGRELRGRMTAEESGIDVWGGYRWLGGAWRGRGGNDTRLEIGV